MAVTHLPAAPDAPYPAMVPSTGWLARLAPRSWMILGAGTAAVLGVYAVQLFLLQSGSVRAATAVSDVGEALIIGWAALMIFLMAAGLPDRDVLRDQWFTLGAAAGAFFVGDVLWAFYEVVMGVEVPSPGWPDLGYAASYLLFALAIIYAAVTYAHGVNLRWPTWLAAAAGAVLSVGAIPLAVQPIIAGSEPILGRITSIAYIYADIWLEIVPALFIALVVSRTGRTKDALAWRIVAVGVGLIGLADVAYGLLAANGLYGPGSPVDMGWMLGYVLLAVAASAARDAHALDGLPEL